MAKIPVHVLILTAVFLWGANFNMGAVAVESLPVLTAAGTRFAISAVLMIALVALRGEWLGYMKSIRSPDVLMAGFVGIGCFNLLFFFSVAWSSPVNSALIMGATPLITVLVAYLWMRERPSLRALVAMPVALAGVAAVILGGSHAGPVTAAWGDLFMILADLSFAVYSLIARRTFPVGGAMPDATAMVTVGALVTGIAGILGCLIDGVPDQWPSLRSTGAILGMAIGGSVLTYVFWNEGVRRIGSSRAILFMNLVPVFTVLIATLFGDPPTAMQMLGGALVIGAVLWSSWPRGSAVKQAG